MFMFGGVCVGVGKVVQNEGTFAQVQLLMNSDVFFNRLLSHSR